MNSLKEERTNAAFDSSFFKGITSFLLKKTQSTSEDMDMSIPFHLSPPISR